MVPIFMSVLPYDLYYKQIGGGVTSFPCGDPRVGGDRIADGRVRASFVRSFVPGPLSPPPILPHRPHLPIQELCLGHTPLVIVVKNVWSQCLQFAPTTVSSFSAAPPPPPLPPIATHSAPLARLKQQKLGSQLSPALWAAEIQTICGQS